MKLALSVAAFLALFASPLFADVTVGNLSRATGSPIIQDSLNDREWLGWEVTIGFTYAQLISEGAPGGRFAGFKVANNDDAQMFVTAMLGAHLCTASDGPSFCIDNSYSLAREGLVGETFADLRVPGGYSFDYDQVFFLIQKSGGPEAGVIEVYNDDVRVYGFVAKGNGGMTVPLADLNSTDTTRGGSWRGISWLMYKDVSPVPEPDTYALMLAGLGLVGFASCRRKRE